jgi:DNA excision repair protein ERCC-4
MKDLGSDDDLRGATYEAYASTLRNLSDRNASSRKAGALEEIQNVGSIVVDVREFRSSLPSLLHARNVKIIPCTLEVGDYVLSPSLCVERKSLSDLFSSFLSGRLYKQVAIMSRHYKSPILLIEFDRSKPFMLLTRRELGSDINSKHIISKISLLILHFPQLRYIWSRDSHATSETFIHLKQGLPQPNLEQALLSSSESGSTSLGLVGVGDLFGNGKEEETEESSTVMTSYDILRKLPGVNANNIRLIIQSITSLRDLCSKSEEDLSAIMGEVNASKLFNFLHGNITNLFT